MRPPSGRSEPRCGPRRHLRSPGAISRPFRARRAEARQGLRCAGAVARARDRRGSPGRAPGSGRALPGRALAGARAAGTRTGRQNGTPATGRRSPRPRRSRRRGRRAGHAAGLLALRPVELLVDLVLGVAALEEGLPRPTGSCRGCRTCRRSCRRRQPELVEDRGQDRLDPAGPAHPVRVARVVRARDGRDVRDRVLAGGLPLLERRRDSPSSSAYDTPLRKTARRGRPSIRSWRIIATNGALPVPDEMNMCVRSSSGSSMNLPFGPIIRIRCPTGSSHRSGVNVPPWTSRR